MEAYTFSQKETEAAATQNQELQNDIYRKNRDLEHLRNMIENINQDRATTKSNFITSNKENCDLRVKVEILEERLETQAAEIQNMLRQHETEVMQLKARLYDLMTAKK
jgi:predicted nuclease with TOPRIM domain